MLTRPLVTESHEKIQMISRERVDVAHRFSCRLPRVFSLVNFLSCVVRGLPRCLLAGVRAREKQGSCVPRLANFEYERKHSRYLTRNISSMLERADGYPSDVRLSKSFCRTIEVDALSTNTADVD